MTNVTINNYYDYGISIFNAAKDKCITTYNAVKEEGEPQNKALALGRSLVGIYAVTQDPISAGLGAIVAACLPTYIGTGTNLADGAITGMWNNSSFKGRAAVVVGGVTLYTLGVPYLGMLATVFSFKLGAEHTLRLLENEQVHLATKQIKQKKS